MRELLFSPAHMHIASRLILTSPVLIIATFIGCYSRSRTLNMGSLVVLAVIMCYLALEFAFLIKRYRRTKSLVSRFGAMICIRCGYPRSGISDDTPCSECGMPYIKQDVTNLVRTCYPYEYQKAISNCEAGNLE
jgi:hypothetical protein